MNLTNPQALMLKTIKEMFQEAGEGSMMRCLSFMLVTAGIALAFTRPIDSNTITLIYGFVGSGLTLSGGTLSASGGGGGDFVLISSQDASASATIDFTGLSSTYSTYKIIISNMVSSTNNVIPSLRVGTGGTPTYQTGNVYSWIRIYSAGTVVSGNNTSDSKILIGSNGTQSSTATQSHNMEITIVNPSQSTDYHHVYGKISFIDSAGTFVMQDFVGVYLSTTAVTAIRIYMSSGNIASGKFNLYGIT